MRARRFTLEAAIGLIPRLSQLLPQLQNKKRALDTLKEKLMAFAQKMEGNGHLLEKEMNETRQEMEMAAHALNSLIEKVQDLGCEMKDIDMGLIDFRSEQWGREVYLCWRLGEETIGWWHELEAGYASRQPLKSGQ